MSAESPIRRLVRNAGILLSGGVVGAGLAFVTTLLVARYLSAAELGRIVLVQSLVLGVGRLVNFQSWRTVIKYGADALEAGDEAGYERVLKFGCVLDLITAGLGALAVAGASVVAAHLLDWDRTTHMAALVYGCVVALNLTGMPIAVLRTSDKFGVFVWQRALAGGTKLLGVGVAWWLDLGALFVLGAWMVGDAVAHLSVIIPGWFELRRQGRHRFWRRSLRGVRVENPGILHFSVVSNLSTGLRLATRQLDDFVVGAILSESAVGLYKIAKQFATLISLAIDPLRHAVYPELTKQAAAGDVAGFASSLRASFRIAAALAVPYWALFALAGGWILRITVGEEFVAAHEVLVWYTAGQALWLLGFVLPPATLSLGRPQAPLYALVGSTAVYFAALPLMVRAWGLAGAGVALLVFYAVWALMLSASLRTAFSAWRASPPAPRERGRRDDALDGGEA